MSLKQKENLSSLLLVFLLATLLFFRHPDQLVHPQFWVEGSYIYSYASKTPLFEYLFSPLYGYFMLPQRLIVILFTPLVPIEYHPHICVAVSVIITLLIPLYFYRTPTRLPAPSLFILAIFLSPSEGSEIFSKLLYLMWILPIVFLFILFRDASKITKQVAFIDLIWIGIAGLAGPLVILFVPTFLIVSFFKREKYFYAVTAGVCLCGFIQLLYLIEYPQSVSNQNIYLLDISKLLNSLVIYVFPQYIVPKLALPLGVAIAFTLSLFGSAYFLSNELRKEAYILFVLIFSFLIPAMIKLSPFFCYISGSRYLYFPYLFISFYLLLLFIKGGRYLKIVAGTCLLVAFLFHLPYYQIGSADYKWKEHLDYAKINKCRARVPIPYTGKDGVAWVYEYGTPENKICSNRPIIKWIGGASEKISLEGEGKFILSSKQLKAVFSLERIEVSPLDSLVDFSLLVKVNRAYKHQIGVKFYDENNIIIKELNDRLDISALPVVVAQIPKGTKYLRPFIRLSSRDVVEVSDIAILIL